MLDIGHFKRVNDTHKHDAVDQILKSVASTLLRSLRKHDLVGRWGGEEFLVLLRGASPGNLCHLAERCRTLVEASRILYREEAVSVTISIRATLASKRDSVASIVKRVDRLLYEGKVRGRNRTTIG